jgi:polar amino acid transport system substrate-binding protein
MKKTLSLITIAIIVSMIVTSFSIAEDLDKIKQAKKMQIAMSGAYPPFNFINEKNEVVGFDPAIGKEIAKRIGVEGVIVTAAFDGILAGLMANKYDAICGSLTITDKRKEVVDFVGPYYRGGRGVFVHKDSGIKSLGDLKGKTVGAGLGETHEAWAKTQEGWKVRTYKGLPEELLDLENKRIDAVVADSLAGLLAIKKSGQPLKKLETPNISGGDVTAGIAIRQNNPMLKAAMQKALDDMMADGTYRKIAIEWIGHDIR